MDATNDTTAPSAPSRHRRRHKFRLPHVDRRHRRRRSQPEHPEPDPQAINEVDGTHTSTPQPVVDQFDASTAYPNQAYGFSVENKMGLPPPYDQATSNPAPPPSYFGGSPPPPPGMVVAPTAPPRTQVITSQPTVTHRGAAPKLGPGPTGATCATCNRQVVTRLDYVPNNRTHIVSAALCVLAGCCCGCFVPYCMRSCKTANHYCPQCKAFIGSYQPS